VFKGYARAQFEDAWSRYLPPAPVGPAAMESVTSVTPQVTEQPVTDSAESVTDRKDPA
jgi:hypothetical protein